MFEIEKRLIKFLRSRVIAFSFMFSSFSLLHFIDLFAFPLRKTKLLLRSVNVKYLLVVESDISLMFRDCSIKSEREQQLSRRRPFRLGFFLYFKSKLIKFYVHKRIFKSSSPLNFPARKHKKLKTVKVMLKPSQLSNWDIAITHSSFSFFCDSISSRLSIFAFIAFIAS